MQEWSQFWETLSPAGSLLGALVVSVITAWLTSRATRKHQEREWAATSSAARVGGTYPHSQ